ncbi:MAG: PPC domain-containing protein, partial [Acidobacteriia bacterium]|nr:PPC domain-containing protein [Terriglobia bacterium]
GTGCSDLMTGASTAQLGGTDCTNSPCDNYSLTIVSANTGDVVDIAITWTNPANDFDLYVYDSKGNLVGSSTGGAPETEEKVTIAAIPGTYTVTTLEFTVVASNYTGTVNLHAAPATIIPAFVTGGVTFSPNVTIKAPVADRDGEPSDRVDFLGNAYTSGIRGVPAGVDLWWFDLNPSSSTFDPQLRNPAYRGQPDSFPESSVLDVGADGGGDVDLAVGFQPPSITTNGIPNLTVTSLVAANVSSARSQDTGLTFEKDPNASTIPSDDRQWVEALGGDVVFLSYRAPVPATALFVGTSTDGGLTYPTTSIVSTGGSTPGYISVDQQNQIVYVGHHNSSAMFVSAAKFDSNNPQLPMTFSTTTVDSTTSHGHLFDVVKVGHDGTVYGLWSNDQNVYLSYSLDHGRTWSNKIQVNNPNFVVNDRFGNPQTVKTNIFPWMEAGSAGRVDIVWFGTTESTNDDNADWNVFFAQSLNANTSSPTFRQVKASDHFIHAGNISEGGLTGTANRNLADYFQVALDPQGGAFISFSDDHNDFSGNVYVTRQLSGPSAFSAANGNGTVATVKPAPIPTQDPSAPQVTDFVHDAEASLLGPINTDSPYDIASIRYGCETTVDGNTLITAAMKVSNLSTVPPQANWRISFTANALAGLADRGDQFFLQASTETQTPSFTYGTAVRNSDGSTTYTTRGSADVGFFDTTTNTVNIKVNTQALNMFASKPLVAGSSFIGLRGRVFSLPVSVPAVGTIPVIQDITRGGSIPIGSPLQGDSTAGIGETSFSISQCAGATTNPPPPPPPSGEQEDTGISGSGSISPNGQDEKFDFEADNVPSGHVQYQDKANNIDLVSTSMSFFQSSGANCISFGGTARVNGSAGHLFTINACDNGEPGTGTDSFSISIDNSYSRSGTLTKGNIEFQDK